MKKLGIWSVLLTLLLPALATSGELPWEKMLPFK
jgi:hypothetical protein